MRDTKVSKLTTICIAAFMSLSCLSSDSPQVCSPEDLKANLMQSGKALLEKTKTGKHSEILEMIVESGFGFEASKRYSHSEIQQMFEEKRKFYCYFFDSECIEGSITDGKRWYSFQETLGSTEKVSVTVSLQSEKKCEDIKSGFVQLEFESGPVEELMGVFFYFTYDKGWKLSGFSHGLSGRK